MILNRNMMSVSPVERGMRCVSNASWTDGLAGLPRARHPVRRILGTRSVEGGRRIEGHRHVPPSQASTHSASRLFIAYLRWLQQEFLPLAHGATMSAFYDQIDEILGNASDATDIVACVRKCWLYDFADDPIRLWDGQGNFIDADGYEWIGTVTPGGANIHKTPALQDGRDGTSPTYNFSLTIPATPGQGIEGLYDALKADQSKVFGRTLTCYLVLFVEGEGLRPNTPLSFYRQLTMFSPKFSERIDRSASGTVVKNYTVSLVAKDDNHGRSETPDRTYADSMQKRRAAQLGVTLDRGAEFLALLANRTYQVP